MNNKVSLSYEDLEKDLEVEIFGLKFGIKMDEEYLRKCEDFEKNVEGLNDIEVAKKSIDTLLGEDAYRKIKNKYEKDTGKEIDDMVWIKVIYTVVGAVQAYTSGDLFTDNKPMNRTQRRYNSRRYDRRNYRRYDRRNYRR